MARPFPSSFGKPGYLARVAQIREDDLPLRTACVNFGEHLLSQRRLPAMNQEIRPGLRQFPGDCPTDSTGRSSDND